MKAEGAPEPSGGGGGGGALVRPLALTDVAASARLHREVLDVEFLSRCGLPFLRTYHQAWLASPASMAVAAGGSVEGGPLAGVLLGSWNPAAHVRAMVSQHGVALVAQLGLAAARDPALARELLVTRGRRYARGLWRHVTTPRRRAAPAAKAGIVGEITHVMVAPACQGRGVGRALLAAAERSAFDHGVRTLVLVTPPGAAAEAFYERLGWERDGAVTSRSGEPFVRYRRRLGADS